MEVGDAGIDQAHRIHLVLREGTEGVVEVGVAKREHVDDGGRDGPGVGSHVLVEVGADFGANIRAQRREARVRDRFKAIAEAEGPLQLLRLVVIGAHGKLIVVVRIVFGVCVVVGERRGRSRVVELLQD